MKDLMLFKLAVYGFHLVAQEVNPPNQMKLAAILEATVYEESRYSHSVSLADDEMKSLGRRLAR